MVGLLGNKLGSDCGGSFMPSIGLEFFLRHAEPLEALSRESCGGDLSFREMTLTSDGERNALGMSHEWDVVIWGARESRA